MGWLEGAQLEGRFLQEPTNRRKILNYRCLIFIIYAKWRIVSALPKTQVDGGEFTLRNIKNDKPYIGLVVVI